VEGPCEHGSELSGSIKYWEILEYLRNWRLLKKDSAPLSYFLKHLSFRSPFLPYSIRKQRQKNRSAFKSISVIPLEGVNRLRLHSSSSSNFKFPVLGLFHVRSKLISLGFERLRSLKGCSLFL
jgi:hypothetical protein